MFDFDSEGAVCSAVESVDEEGSRVSRDNGLKDRIKFVLDLHSKRGVSGLAGLNGDYAPVARTVENYIAERYNAINRCFPGDLEGKREEVEIYVIERLKGSSDES